jgi:hypothetical protein
MKNNDLEGEGMLMKSVNYILVYVVIRGERRDKGGKKGKLIEKYLNGIKV